LEKNIKNRDKFIKKAFKKYGNRFNYSLIDYVKSDSPIEIICNEHKITFYQTPLDHIRGYKKCVLCGGNVKTFSDFLIKAINIHGNRYDYSKVNYVNATTKINIICNKHGEFNQLPNGHYKSGCQKCFLESNNVTENLETFLTKAMSVHGKQYDYTNVNYVNSKTKIDIICDKHGKFQQLPYSHLRGKGCNSCGVDSTKIKLSLTNDEFIERANKRHINKYKYIEGNYINMITKYKIICPKHGEFNQLPYDHLNGHGCSKCNSIVSSQEIEINSFITNELKLNTVTSHRGIINGKELDIYIPSKKIAIEFDGLYWHSELFMTKDYHLNKTQLCEESGIQLIHIFEDEWLYKKEIVKSRLRNILGLTKNVIYARKCVIKQVENLESKDFLNDNHLQGSITSTNKLGLYYNNELVSLMLFNNPRLGIGQKTDHIELSRFCNKLDTSVIGGASRLLKHFIREYKPKEIISYADKRWSGGALYDTLGFTKHKDNKPNYWYIINKKRKHRFGFRKSVLSKLGFDENLTEREIMYNRGIYRIYDCGTITYKKTP
tara:strand:+ start:272 stop:1915 length:1644 start_codon:yes stop_codon:yes gene_type:complete